MTGQCKRGWRRRRVRRLLLLGLACAVGLLLAPAAAGAALWTSTPDGKWPCKKANNGCVAHTGFRPNAKEHWGQAKNPLGNCTNYAAYRLEKNGAQKPAGLSGGAGKWAEKVRQALGRERVNSTAAVGSLAWWPAGRLASWSPGHVAYVEKIVDGALYLSDSSYGIGSERKIVKPGDPKWPAAFLHIKDKPKSASKPKPADPDRDGLTGSADRCPTKKGPKSNRGCPLPKPGEFAVTGFYTPLSGDFDGDGHSDVFWYGPGDGPDRLWYGTETAGVFSKVEVTVKGTYAPVVGDFNGDGRTDILWYGPGDGSDSLWFGGPGRPEFASVDTNVIGTYAPLSGDFDGDGRSDVFWYGPGDGPDRLWYGTETAGSFTNVVVSVKGTYNPVTGDFDGDGRSDILWYGPGDGSDTLWYGSATRPEFVGAGALVKGTYAPLQGDFNGDGKGDIFWYGPGDAYDALWYGSSARGEFASADITVKGTYTPVVGDFNGDGRTDVIWYGPGDGYDSLWSGQAGLGEFS